MNILKKFISLLGKPSNKKNVTEIKFEIFGKEYSKTINATPEQVDAALKAMNNKNDIGEWVGSNEVETIREDGYIIYKGNRVTNTERNQIGFYGLKWYSENGKYCVVYCKECDDKFNVGLVDVASKIILYQKKLQRPFRCKVSDNGIVACEDWGGYDTVTTNIVAMDIDGRVLVKKGHRSAVGDLFEISDDGKTIVYTMNLTGKKLKLDIP